MSNRKQKAITFPIDIGKVGAAWVASFSLFGISSIGATEEEAEEKVREAIFSYLDAKAQFEEAATS